MVYHYISFNKSFVVLRYDDFKLNLLITCLALWLLDDVVLMSLRDDLAKCFYPWFTNQVIKFTSPCDDSVIFVFQGRSSIKGSWAGEDVILLSINRARDKSS